MHLRAIRVVRGLTQVELSRRSGVSQPAISAIETGRRRMPTWMVAKRLADALSVQPELLFPVPEPKSQVTR